MLNQKLEQVTEVAESDGRAIDSISEISSLQSRTLPTSPLLEIERSGTSTNLSEFLRNLRQVLVPKYNHDESNDLLTMRVVQVKHSKFPKTME